MSFSTAGGSEYLDRPLIIVAIIMDHVVVSLSCGCPKASQRRCCTCSYKGPGAGVTLWDARPDVFPDGLAGFHEKTGWPTMLHNRMWSP